MITIQLYKYKDVDITIQLPTEWNECALHELKLITAAIFLKKYSDFELLIEFIRYRIGVARPTETVASIQRIILLLNIEDLSLTYTDLLSFIHDDIRLTNQPIKKLAQLVGPDSDFTNLTCAEFEDAEFHLNEWIELMKTEEGKALEINLPKVIEIIAILWRPISVPYHEYKPSEDIKAQLASLNPSLLYVALLWFMGCKAELPESYPFVYGRDEKVITIGTPNNDTLAFTKLIHHGAGTKNGTRADIRKMPIREFLFDLNLTAENQPKEQ